MRQRILLRPANHARTLVIIRHTNTMPQKPKKATKNKFEKNSCKDKQIII